MNELESLGSASFEAMLEPPGEPWQRTVALVGKSPLTQQLVAESGADEIWGAGTSYLDVDLDRLYEVHSVAQLQDPHYVEGHWDWLTSQDTVDRVIMVQPSDEVIGAEQYPLREAMQLSSGLVRALGEPQLVFTNSFDFMIAHAILEDFTRIEIYGFDIVSKNTEYLYQVPGVAFWMGLAAGSGIEIVLPDASPLMRAGIYAWESGGQVIARHQIDVRLHKYRESEKAAQNKLNYLRGALQGAAGLNGNAAMNKHRQAIMASIDEAEKSLFVKAGARLALEQMIAECDYAEPEFGIENPFKVKREVP